MKDDPTTTTPAVPLPQHTESAGEIAAKQDMAKHEHGSPLWLEAQARYIAAIRERAALGNPTAD